MNDVIGLGYQGRDLAGFLAEVADAGVQVVVDVRLTPMSRKRGFAKRALAEALSSIGVAYRHEPALGNPKVNRPGFAGSARELAAARRRYAALLAAPAAQEALARIAATAEVSRVGLLCFETEQRRCHRDVVLAQLVQLTTVSDNAGQVPGIGLPLSHGGADSAADGQPTHHQKDRTVPQPNPDLDPDAPLLEELAALLDLADPPPPDLLDRIKTAIHDEIPLAAITEDLSTAGLLGPTTSPAEAVLQIAEHLGEPGHRWARHQRTTPTTANQPQE
jgi:hypothetical protein